MDVNKLIQEVVEATPSTSMKVVKASKDKKFLLMEDDSVLNLKNVINSQEKGLITIEDDTITLVKGRAFVNDNGITFFTDKEEVTPSFD